MANRGVQALVFSIMRYCGENDDFVFTVLSDDIVRDQKLLKNFSERQKIKFILEKNPFYMKITSKVVGLLPANVGFIILIFLSFLPWRLLGIRNFSLHDFAISTGGDLYTPEYGFPVLQMARDLKLSRETKLILFGASFNKFSSGEQLFKKFIQKLPKIYVRESASLKYLEDMGIQADRCYDPAFYLPFKQKNKQKTVGINLSPYVIKNHSRLTKFAQEIKNYQQDGYAVVYLSHVYDNENNGDREIFHKLNKKLESPLIDLTFNLDAIEAKSKISSLSLVISARTHVCIAGYSSGVPTIGVSYSYKSIGLNYDITANPKYIRMPDDKMESKLHDIISDYPSSDVIDYTNVAIEQNRRIFKSLFSDQELSNCSV
jgi:polysaccharide pyruvyl transferase WcaK-like protein